MTDTWEQRMAAKAAKKQDDQYAEALAISLEESSREKEEWISDYQNKLTLAEAVAEDEHAKANPVGCACMGGPYCCQIRYQARQRVIRGV